MGHLISRAFKRLTQCTQSRNQLQHQEQQHQSQHQTQRNERDNDNQNIRQPERCYVESIPIGQSIDSAECRNLGLSDLPRESEEIQQEREQNGASSVANVEISTDENSKQDVEDAVIKIQALVRGHLTRKALKDAHHHSIPPPNALGQRQFDEDSLTKNPPSAVFLPNSPLNLVSAEHQQTQADRTSATAGTGECHQARSQLESIAEVTETNNSNNNSSSNNNNNINSSSQLERDNEQTNLTRKKPSCVGSRSASSPSKLEMPTSEDITSTTNRSLSPALSDAGASIDLSGCTTPASASIIISDHNIKAVDKIATVLHAKSDDANKASTTAADATAAQDDTEATEPISPEPLRDIGSRAESNLDEGVDVTADNRVPLSGTPDSFESEEAAAIRIQSAFRGYRTRKNSPYRTRSPTSSAAAASKRSALRQQEATEILHENDDELDLNANSEQQLATDTSRVGGEGRRLSRTRHRDSFPDSDDTATAAVATPASVLQVESSEAADIEPIIHSAPSIEEFTTTEDTTTVKEAPLPQQPSSSSRKTSDSIREQQQQQQQQQQEKQNDELHVTVANNNQEQASISLDIGVDTSEQLSNTLDEVGLSAALESAQTTNNEDGFYVEGVPDSSKLARPSLGGKSEASVELDTDSSVLGAALSLNEDISVVDSQEGGAQQAALTATTGATTILLEPGTEDRSQGPTLTTDEPDSERYVDYITNSEALTDAQAASALDEATDQLEAALEEATEETGNEGQSADDVIELVAPPLLDEDEQRAIEEESDDIERRDPSGQVSEERAISPQIRTEPPEFESFTGAEQQPEEENVEEAQESPVEEETVEALEAGSLLAVKKHDDAVSSGRSSAAGSSSDAGDSSSDHEKSPKQGELNDQKQQQQQQQQQQQVQSGKNKKKNRKRKGKK